jgi:two-component system phosphate regulon sensor histidine kinase PhoR
MSNYRPFSALAVAALIALIVVLTYSSGIPHWLFISGLTVFMGLALGVLLRRPVLTSRRFGQARQESRSRTGAIDFSSDLLDTTVNEMREGLLVIDSEMRVLASNRAARSLFTNVDDSINLRRLTELTRNPAIYDAFLDAVRGTERVGVKVETYGPAKRTFDLRVVPLRQGSGKGPSGAVGVFFDVTRLERLELVRQEFLSNVSHELRTPLTSIMALARMHRLIDDILELSAIEAGNVKVKPDRVELYPLVEDVIGSLSTVAAARQISLRNLVAVEASVFADPHRLVQMLTNLFDNAIKFNREGGAVSVRHQRNGVDQITVEDTGEGIPAHHLDRLFERFYRVDRARSRELGGTGLGLAIVKHLAKAHGGEITVESRFGEGTKFTIELPIEIDAVGKSQDAANSAG